MPVGEMLERMSSRELSEWMVFFGIEGPTGDERADWRAALVASTIANVNRDPKKRKQPFAVEDFMPRYKIDRERSDDATDDEARSLALAGYARQLQRQLGGRLVIGDGE